MDNVVSSFTIQNDFCAPLSHKTAQPFLFTALLGLYHTVSILFLAEETYKRKNILLTKKIKNNAIKTALKLH